MQNGVKLVVWLLMAAALALPHMAVAQEAAETDAPVGGIYIFSLTTGARLLVDGTEIGTIPHEGLVPLTAGQHTIKLMRRGFAQRTEVVEISAGEELELEWDLVPFAGVVRITSNAGKAALWLNGKPFGEIPFDGEIPMGSHKLKAVAPGFDAVERDLEVNGGEEYTFTLDMKPAPVEPIKAAAGSSLLNKWWFWTATGAVVVGGIVTGLVVGSSGEGEAPPSPQHTLVF